jgi:disulfide bond formation protein DsbB
LAEVDHLVRGSRAGRDDPPYRERGRRSAKIAGMIAWYKSRSFAEQSLLAATFVSAALLAGAHVFQAFGYAPCPLCMDQREAHWAALTVLAAGLFCSIVMRAPLGAAAAAGAAALVYAASAALSGYHTGVEFGFWPGPPTCSQMGAVATDVGGLSDALNGPAHSPSCSEAQWRLFGISMAGYNFIASVGLFALTGAAAMRAAKAARASRRPSGAPAE